MKKIIVVLASLFLLSKFSNAQFYFGEAAPAKLNNEAVGVVTAFLEAVKAKNRDKVILQLDPQVEWEQPGNNSASGTKKGTADVLKMFGVLLKISEHTLVLAEVKTMAVNGNMVACLLRWTATQPNGKVLDVDNIDVYTVENGKITKARIFSANLQMEDEFWGKE